MTHSYLINKLKEHLQTAIEIEHATLPPYLTAYWSVFGTSEHAQNAAALILSVIREEMLHMGMACNILNALGGKPLIQGKEFIPDYPSYLPGHSHTVNAFKVGLAPCSADAIETFMRIELPEEILEEVHLEKKWATIGQFYRMIIHLINDPIISDDDFRHGGQIDNSANPAHGILYTVSSREEAVAAMEEILDQGEGHNLKNHYDKDHELTHYWKFNEIFHLINSGKWKIEEDVYPVAPNPDENYFSDEAKQFNKKFNTLYSNMLDALHLAYNGYGNIQDGIYIMLMLEPIAKKLMQIPLIGKEGNAGPTFKYISDSEPDV